MSVQAGILTYDIVCRTQTDAAIDNVVMNPNVINQKTSGGFGPDDMSTDPLINGDTISHAFTFYDPTNNVNWGYTLTIVGSTNIDGTGSGFGINNAQFDQPGETATFSLSATWATANNPGETATVNSMVLDRIEMNGFTNPEGLYSIAGAGTTVTNNSSPFDFGVASDSSVVLTHLAGTGVDDVWRVSFVGVQAEVDVIPEPATLGLLGIAGGGLLVLRRRRLQD
jgi:hypothetical protein